MAIKKHQLEVILFLIRTAMQLGLTDKAMDFCMEFGIKKFRNKFKNIKQNFKSKKSEPNNEIKTDNETKTDDDIIVYRKEKVKNDNNKNTNEKFVVAAYLKQCLERIKEIKKMIKKIDYSDRKSYIDEILDIENNINKELVNIISFGESNIDKTNKIIDRVNEIYKNAYKRKNNISSLSYIIEVTETEEEISLINNIDINNFK